MPAQPVRRRARTRRPAGQDNVLDAFEALLEALKSNEAATRELARRARILRTARAAGLAYAEIVAVDDRPLEIELLRGMQERLNLAGRRLRAAEARALRDEGLTLDRIAEVFGVSRQRVIALLRE
jgi:hypothetical protein